jgi:hypothetical protein
LDNINNFNDSLQTLQFYAVKSCLIIHDHNIVAVDTCILKIKTAWQRIKQEINKQTQAKEQYQLYLASDIIDQKYSHLFPSTSISYRLERDDLTERKLKYMSEATARRNLFAMLKFDIKGFIYPDSIKMNALTRVDVTINICISPLTTKSEVEYHLLSRNHQAYWEAGSTHFVQTPLR